MLEADYLRRAAAEFVGTFALVVVVIGGIQRAQVISDVAIAQGLAIAVMVSAVGHISGGHFNPAITFGLWLTRRITTTLGILYVVTQLVAATLAALLMEWVLTAASADGSKLGAPQLGQGIGQGEALVIEAVISFFLVWVVFATAVDPRGTFRSIAGLAIGLTVAMNIYVAAVLSGGAMNPARAFGPQFVEMLFGPNAWANWWVWYVGPLAGGAIAALLYEVLYLRPERPEPVGPPETGVQEPAAGETSS